MNIKLTEEAMGKLNSFRMKYKDRGLKTKDWNILLSRLILNSSESEWEALIEKLTPVDYHFNNLQKDPSFKEELVKMMLKKAKTRNSKNEIETSDSIS